MKRLITVIIAAMSCQIILAQTPEENFRKNLEAFRPVVNRLYENGVDSGFVFKLLSHPDTEFDESFVKINVVGYGKPASYAKHYNAYSVKKSKEFYKEYYEVLDSAEKKYGVPKNVITSILWIETRHGGYLGNSHVPSVYLSTALACQPEYFSMNLGRIYESRHYRKSREEEMREKILARSIKKSEWAFGQLLALEELNEVSPVDVMELRGSWAGAFGISQFLPSSYMSWAVDGDGDNIVNLFEYHDAIFSVANYLKTNGWGPTDKEQKSAVFHYNNSTAYVNAVLKLAELIKK